MQRHRTNLLLSIPFLGALAGGAYFMDKVTPVGIGLCLTGFAIAIVGCVRQVRNLRRYTCPTCRQLLSRETGKAGEQITFFCRACDTIWDTGFQESRD